VYEDSGRMIRPVFPGYRVVVTREDGSQAWCNLPRAGQEAFLEDYMSGGGPGGVWRLKRSLGRPVSVQDWGYNQVFQEIFAAYEPRLTPKGKRQWQTKVVLDHRQRDLWDCPAEGTLAVHFTRTNPEFSLQPLVDKLPAVAFMTFAFTFVFGAIAYGIFRTKKQMPSDPLQAMEFAQSKAKARKDGQTEVRFEDVAGIETVKEDLMEIVSFLKDPAKASRLGAKAPKGVLLEGPPGTGKTLIAKAIAGEAGVPFYQMSGSEFVEVIVGVGAARVRDLFKRARARADMGGCIIFVDEIDAIGIKRAGVGQETNEEREQTLNQLLTEMDGFASDTGVVFIAATNRADLLDPALLRAGRFDRKVRVTRPDERGRLAILRVHARRFQLHDSVDLPQLARDLLGMSGAQLENVLNEGALEAIRRMGLWEEANPGRRAGDSPDCPTSITAADVDQAVDRITQGVRRPSLVPGGAANGDRRRANPQMRALAATEAGKAVVALSLRQEHGRLEELERISVVPRGFTLSRAVFARGTDEDYAVTTKGKLLDRLRALLAGRAGQEVLLGEATTYDAESLEVALMMALKMVSSYGFGGELYRWAPSLPTFDNSAFIAAFDGDILGHLAQETNFPPSDGTLHRVKQDTLRTLLGAYGDAVGTIRANRALADDIAAELLVHEELDARAIEEIVARHGGIRRAAGGEAGEAGEGGPGEAGPGVGAAGTGDWGRQALETGADDLARLIRAAGGGEAGGGGAAAGGAEPRQPEGRELVGTGPAQED